MLIWQYLGDSDSTWEIVLVAEVRNIVSVSEDELKAGLSEEAAQVGTEHSLKEPPQGNGMLPSLRPIYGVGFTYMYIHCIYTRLDTTWMATCEMGLSSCYQLTGFRGIPIMEVRQRTTRPTSGCFISLPRQFFMQQWVITVHRRRHTLTSRWESPPLCGGRDQTEAESQSAYLHAATHTHTHCHINPTWYL